MDQPTPRAQERRDLADLPDRDVVEIQEARATKVQGERLLEESRNLNLSSRALLDELSPSSV